MTLGGWFWFSKLQAAASINASAQFEFEYEIQTVGCQRVCVPKSDLHANAPKKNKGLKADRWQRGRGLVILMMIKLSLSHFYPVALLNLNTNHHTQLIL